MTTTSKNPILVVIHLPSGNDCLNTVIPCADGHGKSLYPSLTACGSYRWSASA